MYSIKYHYGAKTLNRGEATSEKEALTMASKLADERNLTLWKGRRGHWCVNDNSERLMPCRHLIVYRDGVPIDSRYA